MANAPWMETEGTSRIVGDPARSANPRVDGEVNTGEARGNDARVVWFEAAAEIRLFCTRDLVPGRSEHDSIPPGRVGHCPTRDAAAKQEHEHHVAGWLRAGLLDNADWHDRASGDGAAETTL